MGATVPGYVRRYTRVLRALEVLWYYPEGLPLVQLAEELGAKPSDLREEILAYYTAEPAAAAGYRLPGIGWISPTGEEVDPGTAEVVVLTDPGALAELGVVRLTPDEMATIWRAGFITRSSRRVFSALEKSWSRLNTSITLRRRSHTAFRRMARR